MASFALKMTPSKRIATTEMPLLSQTVVSRAGRVLVTEIWLGAEADMVWLACVAAADGLGLAAVGCGAACPGASPLLTTGLCAGTLVIPKNKRIAASAAVRAFEPAGSFARRGTRWLCSNRVELSGPTNVPSFTKLLSL